ncbi:nucleoside/nucleotide kinase family protein [Mycobacterium sp. PS03-16]|nr:nucleoside/nucleotide kinase family protein [Mycobacterium sp. PS03-16]
MTFEDALAAVAAETRRLRAGRSGRVLVGLTGPPGTGKSTFAEHLVDALGDVAASYVPMDGFHLATVQLERLGRRDRKGAPDTFDVDGYVATLSRLAPAHRRRDVYVPDFDRSIEEPVAAGRVVPAVADVVITEGNYLALWDDVRPLLDRLYYLDSDRSVRHARLVARHTAGGRDEAQARHWVGAVDEANAERIAATRDRCDRVLMIASPG